MDAITGVLAPEQLKSASTPSIPASFETEGTHSGGIIGSEFVTSIVAQTPLGRVGQPGDIASVATFLAGDDSAG